MSADICSDVGQKIKNEATATSESPEKEHLSSAKENNCVSKKIGMFLLFLISVSISFIQMQTFFRISQSEITINCRFRCRQLSSECGSSSFHGYF